ncbi:MFS transporter [Bacillus alkalicellulosilyticus]|uniref:MFS transporter n=1 Tax=Alkalihalobacterium alkalicellulosilyticum TaxID=1912214 RepID=UPI000996D3AC|nr:MFS transporter [Bacillus alkalicellulosilyticus]
MKLNVFFLYSFILVLMLNVMQSTMVNVAIPFISIELSLSTEQSSLIISIYTLIFAVFVLFFGKLLDNISFRKLLVVSILIVFLGSLIATFSANYYWLLVGRVLQAIGGACIPALAMILPNYLQSDADKKNLLALMASTIALATGLGPVVGGIFTDFLHWRIIFALPAFLILLIPFFLIVQVDNEKKFNKKCFDLVGFMLISLAVTLLFIGINKIWLSLICISIVVILLSFFTMRRKENPYISIHVMSKRYVVLLFFFALSNAVYYGTLFIIPIGLVDIHNISSFSTALILLPGALLSSLFGIIRNTYFQKVNTKVLIYLGYITYLFGATLLYFNLEADFIVLLIPIIFIYLFSPIFQTGITSNIYEVLDPKKIGEGMGIFNLFNFLSISIGVSLAGNFISYYQDFPTFFVFVFFIQTIALIGFYVCDIMSRK